MKPRQKIAVIVWTIDPENTKRFLLRHNKPFNGYEDEWTVTFGGIEEGEDKKTAAIREIFEEYGIKEYEEVEDLNHSIKFESKVKGSAEAHFFAIKVKSIDIPIILNEESIGYDWMKIEKVKEVMKYDDEKKAFDLL
jgi:8-oxo-dGTP pyrophosphatase MutT (NUDIX family)